MMRVVVMVSMCYEVVLSFSPTHNEHIEDIYPSGAQIKWLGCKNPSQWNQWQGKAEGMNRVGRLQPDDVDDQWSMEQMTRQARVWPV